jgi:catechol-2,3-dioxygenase
MTDDGRSPVAGPMTGLSHVQLWVSDVLVSAEWYTAALGLEPFRSDPEIGYVALRHRPARLVIVLTARTGTGPTDRGRDRLDHLAFAVPDGDTLSGWAEHLTRCGIDHPGIVLENGNPSLQLHDPDGTAIELVAPVPSDFGRERYS